MVFRTHEGHYEFTMMSFRLSNTPLSFQALMNSFFKPTLCRSDLLFFDNILIYSANWEFHLEHLHMVFSMLRPHCQCSVSGPSHLQARGFGQPIQDLCNSRLVIAEIYHEAARVSRP